MRRRLTLLVLALMTAVLIGATCLFPVFWPVFVLPCISLIVFQLIAMSGWRRKEVIFKYTDYVYYFLIAAIVGLGSRYLDQRDLVEKFEKRQIAISLEQQVKELDGQLSRLRDMLRSGKPTIEALDPNLAAVCIQQRVITREGGPRNRLVSPEFCDEYLSTAPDAATLSKQIADVERRREAVSQELSNTEVSDRSGNPSFLAAVLGAPEVRFLWIPTLLLVGVTLKLGKTTCGFFPRRNS